MALEKLKIFQGAWQAFVDTPCGASPKTNFSLHYVLGMNCKANVQNKTNKKLNRKTMMIMINTSQIKQNKKWASTNLGALRRKDRFFCWELLWLRQPWCLPICTLEEGRWQRDQVNNSLLAPQYQFITLSINGYTVFGNLSQLCFTRNIIDIVIGATNFSEIFSTIVESISYLKNHW